MLVIIPTRTPKGISGFGNPWPRAHVGSRSPPPIRPYYHGPCNSTLRRKKLTNHPPGPETRTVFRKTDMVLPQKRPIGARCGPGLPHPWNGVFTYPGISMGISNYHWYLYYHITKTR